MTVIRALVMRSVLLALLVQGAAGCSQKIDPDFFVSVETASQFRAGVTVDEVRALTGAEGEFVFQALTDEGEMFGLKYQVGSGGGPLIFVFCDDVLQKICQLHWGDYATKTRGDGKRMQVVVPTDPRHRLAKILKRKALMGEELLAYSRGLPRGKRDPIPNNLIPAIVSAIVVPPAIILWIQGDIRHQQRAKERESLRANLAHNKIKWGMSPKEVQAVYGDPYSVQKFGRVMGCEYGSKRLRARIAVEYLDNKVRAKYGLKFNPNDWTGELRKQVLSECDPNSLEIDYIPTYRSRHKN